MDKPSFSDITIVSCGTLTPELNHLKETGFLDARHIFYTSPGLHERPKELESQLVKRECLLQSALVFPPRKPPRKAPDWRLGMAPRADFHPSFCSRKDGQKGKD